VPKLSRPTAEERPSGSPIRIFGLARTKRRKLALDTRNSTVREIPTIAVRLRDQASSSATLVISKAAEPDPVVRFETLGAKQMQVGLYDH